MKLNVSLKLSVLTEAEDISSDDIITVGAHPEELE